MRRPASQMDGPPVRKKRKWDELACRPGSVTGAPHGIAPAGDHPSRPAVAGRLQRSTRRLGRAVLERLRRLPATVAAGGPLDLAPGGVYRAIPVTRDAGGLLHHRFTLTGPARPLLSEPMHRTGGLLSVALSRGSPRVAVNNHPALRSPDLPRCAHRRCVRRGRPANSSASGSYCSGFVLAGTGSLSDCRGSATWRRLPRPVPARRVRLDRRPPPCSHGAWCHPRRQGPSSRGTRGSR